MTRKTLIWAALIVIVVAAIAATQWPTKDSSPAQVADQPNTASSSQRTVKHAQGETAIPEHPQKVAVFDLNALDTLDALGVDIMAVAGQSFPDYLQKYADKKYLNLGTLFEPNYEAVNAAQPDLIIVGSRSSAKYKNLSGIAPTIDMPTDNSQPMKSSLANAQLLGRIFDKEAQAQALSEELTQAAEQLRAKTADRGKGLIVLVTGGKLSAYGPGSRFGMLHTDFGVPAAAPDLTISLHGEAISSEFILKTNPDWLFVIDRDVAIGDSGAARQVLDNPLVHQTTAWQKDQVVYLNPANWYLIGEGPQAIRAMIRQVDESYDRVAQP